MWKPTGKRCKAPGYRGFSCICVAGIERTAFTVTSTVGGPIRGELLLLTSCQKSMDRLSGEIARFTEFLQGEGNTVGDKRLRLMHFGISEAWKWNSGTIILSARQDAVKVS